MTTKKQRSNLRRGGVPATAETAARAREAKLAHAAEAERIGKLARDDGWKAMEELHETMARALVRLLRQEERAKSKPDPAVSQRLKEFRLGLETLTNYRNARRYSEDSAAEFLGTLAARMQTLSELGEPRSITRVPEAARPDDT